MCSAKKITTERKTDRQSNQRSIWGFIRKLHFHNTKVNYQKLVDLCAVPVGHGLEDREAEAGADNGDQDESLTIQTSEANSSGHYFRPDIPSWRTVLCTPLESMRVWWSEVRAAALLKGFLCHCCCKRNNKIDPELYLRTNQYSIICSFRELNIILK